MKKKTTETGRHVRSPEALTSKTPRLSIDYSAVERRIMKRIKK